ncbi:MAG: hypothetical protein O3B84_01460 [Chloroflexi bacterium]|nr:hypothetical protein [Chloroflexota bacterium]
MPFEAGAELTIEEFRALVQRAELNVADDELPRLRATFESLRAQLSVLHSLDLGARDPAVVFSATMWSGSDGGAPTR